MNGKWLVAVVLTLGWVFPCRAAEEGTFSFYKDVERDKPYEEEILAVTLDSDIYAVAEPRYTDLRVFDTRGQEIPYRLDKVTEDRTEMVRRTQAMKIIDLEEKDDNQIELIVDQGKEKRQVDGLALSTPLKDYQRRITVLGSNDRTHWKPLVSDALIFDYTRYVDLSNGEVDLPKNNDRYFKLIIDEVTDQQQSSLTELTRQFRGGREELRREQTTLRRRPLRINGIQSYRYVRQTLGKQDKKADYPVQFDPARDTTEDDQAKQTILDLGSRREPLTALALATSDANFRRTVSIRAAVERGVTTDWVEVGRGTISAIRFRGIHRRSMKITFPERREKKYRVVIYNEDNPPLKITEVAAEGNVYQALFFVTKDNDYRALYGYPLAQAPRYDTAALGVALAEGYRPVDGSLGPQQDNPKFGGTAGLQVRSFFSHPIVLGAAIGLMVVVLALILFRAGRRIEDIPEE